jgi:hypothetical protein
VKGYPNTATFNRVVRGNFYADRNNQMTVLETSATLAVDRIQIAVSDTGTSQ